MSDLSLDPIALGLLLADRIPAADAEVLRVDADAVAAMVTATGPDADAVADRAQAALAAAGYTVTRLASPLPGAAMMVTVPIAAAGVYDPADQHARELALPGFLDLSRDQWEAWLLADSADLPAELESYAVAVITSFRDDLDGDARGDYMQAIATLSTSALLYFTARVGRF